MFCSKMRKKPYIKKGDLHLSVRKKVQTKKRVQKKITDKWFDISFTNYCRTNCTWQFIWKRKEKKVQIKKKKQKYYL